MILVLSKMPHTHGEPERYSLGGLDLNSALGLPLDIRHTGRLFCSTCGRRIRKTYGNGFCYPCFTSLAQADGCITRPHTCHFHLGTCREPEWGRAHCFIPHIVYLAQTTQVKVGVTGAHKAYERWGDQGAIAACVLARTEDRRTAGLIESALARHMPDRTHWQKLVTQDAEPIDLVAARGRAAVLLPPAFTHLLDPVDRVERFHYPVRRYPGKARAINLTKEPVVAGILLGIKGQYLMIGDRVLNVRRHTGFEIELVLTGNCR